MKDYLESSDVIEKNLKYLMDNHGEIYEAYKNYGKLVHEKGGPLNDKTRWLIKIALSTSSQPICIKNPYVKSLKSRLHQGRN